MPLKYQGLTSASHQSVRDGQNSAICQGTALPAHLGMTCVLLIAVAGCIQDRPAAGTDSIDQAGMEQAHTSLGSPAWQPFTKDSVWNLLLPVQRQEVPLPAAGLAVAPMTVNDGDYGVKVYFASVSDPLWSITFDDYNSVTDNWSPTKPATVRAPAVLWPPTGSDGTVIIVDENRQYVYELWQFSVTRPAARGGTSGPQAHCASLNISDLRTSGIHRNVGITAAGLPGVGGVLRRLEMQSGQPIRHKIWLAIHSDLLAAQAVWPANRVDLKSGGKYPALSYGDVVALAKSYNVTSGVCKLSPVMQRLAQALQDFGGIVQDHGGDSVGLAAEVGALSTHLDIDQAQMWTELLCLRQFLVKVNNPWTGAPPGGLGY